ncbi:FERM central domain-containing protein [Ditylenchus destructor]|nr:FERM central domain-containing protein [Ditylenchus destructor]
MDQSKSHNLELDPLLSEPAEITNTSVNQTKPSDSRSYTRENRRSTCEVYWKPSSTLTVNEPKTLVKKLSDSAIYSTRQGRSRMNNNYSSRKPNRKLSQSRGVDLPIIKLDEIPPAGNPRLLRHGFSRITFPGPPSIIRQDDGRSHPATTSPVGYTLRHSSEHALSQDLNRSTISESFNIGQSDEQDVVDIRIFFPNGKGVQFSVENGQQVPSSTLLDLMADHLKIDSEVASEAFALWLISPLLEVQLKPHHVAYEVHAKWPVFLRKFSTASEEEIALDEPLLVLRRNFQLTVQNELIYLEEYERLTEVLYLDAKDQYLSGRYLVDVGMAVELAALQLDIEFGSYENTRDALDLIHDNMGQLVPPQHHNTIRSFHLFGLAMIECKPGLENAMVDEYKTVSKTYDNNNQKRKAFLEILQKTPFYGAAFFTGTKQKKHGLLSTFFGPLVRHLVSHTTNVLVGINHDYITVIDPSKHELITCQPIKTCCWARSPETANEDDVPLFLLQYPDDSSDSDKSDSPERKVIQTAVSFTVETRKKEASDNGITVLEESSVEQTAIDKLEDAPFVNREVYSKQAAMMEALLNSVRNDIYKRPNWVVPPVH